MGQTPVRSSTLTRTVARAGRPHFNTGTIRRTIFEVLPDAEQVISYRLPAFRVEGATVAGFAAFKNHLSYVPFSCGVPSQLAAELDGYTVTKSALHFPIDQPLPKALVETLIATRLAEAGRDSR